jgi:hypothetical protein
VKAKFVQDKSEQLKNILRNAEKNEGEKGEK